MSYWGKVYEEGTEEFAVFEALNKAKTVGEIKTIINTLSQEKINRINNHCLDGIIFSIENPEKKLVEREFADTCKFYLEKRIINGLDLVSVAENGFTETMYLLLNECKECNIHECGDLALFAASSRGHLTIVDLLVRNGANIHAMSDWAFYGACCFGQVKTAEFFLRRGIKIDDACLKIASEKGHKDVVKLLIKNTKLQSKTLIDACKGGSLEIVKLILENGANIHAYGDEALLTAVINKHVETIKFLLENGANVYSNIVCVAPTDEIVDILIENKNFFMRSYLLLRRKFYRLKTK